ncbi:MAG: hypothetical protein FWE27_03220 [Defluviitaleaceae bacterium]|nr:hypothetical protein [Defluviitaleaceae bacterium]
MRKKFIKNGIFAFCLSLGLIFGLLFANIVSAFNTEVVYKRNDNGQTFGTIEASVNNRQIERPDLISAVGIDGTIGFVSRADLDGERPSNPEEAMRYMEELNRQATETLIGLERGGSAFLRYIPLYESDGVTVIGKFGISFPDEVLEQKSIELGISVPWLEQRSIELEEVLE